MRAERINEIARLCKAKRYLEIGVSEGATFFAVDIAEKVAVDPSFMIDIAAKADATTTFHAMPSDRFFQTVRCEPFDVIYLDGLHTYEQTLRDFMSSLACAHARTVWILDDTVPNDNFAALPDQHRCFRLRHATGNPDWSWMGDVFKVVFFIRTIMRNYQYRTFGGHGQTVVWRDLSRVAEVPGVPAAEVGQMTYEDFRDHYDAMMNPADDAQIYADLELFLAAS